MIAAGSTLRLGRAGTVWTVGALLGEGGQGSVHELVAADGSGRRLALKWYAPASATPRQWEAIETLVRRGSPGPMFLWPLEVVGAPDDFGYVMPFRPEGHVGLYHLLRPEVSTSTAIRVCLGIAHAFLQLHAQGLCYRDISFGNIMADPATGAISVCDNDNVGIEGGSRSAVLGTRRFMAPEVIRGEALPSTQTDLHSLAVLIYYVLFFGHPLLGRRELDHPHIDRAAESLLFGTDPLFVFDPDDRANAPDPQLHAGPLAAWALYPPWFHRLFRQAFGPGLWHPTKRVRESVWRAALARLLDGIATCPSCGKENLSDDGVVGLCWCCQEQLPAPVRLRFEGGGVLVLGAHTALTAHHLHRSYDYSTVVGTVSQHPSRPIWGLRNVGAQPWAATTSGGSTTVVDPGQALTLQLGTVIDFGAARATLEG